MLFRSGVLADDPSERGSFGAGGPNVVELQGFEHPRPGESGDVGGVEQAETGTAAGLYSMCRFLGSAIGTALSGVLLQEHIDAALDLLSAYQQVFSVIALFPALGILVALSLRDD